MEKQTESIVACNEWDADQKLFLSFQVQRWQTNWNPQWFM